MLGQTTKNDLSFNHAEVDHGALLTVARLAFFYGRERCEKHLGNLIRPPGNGRVCLYTDAQYLAKDANNLAVIAETLYTLEESLTREELEIVNKPPVPPEE